MVEKYPEANHNYEKNGWMIQNGYGGRNDDQFFYVVGTIKFNQQNNTQIKFELFDNWFSKDNILKGFSDDVIERIHKKSTWYEFSILKG